MENLYNAIAHIFDDFTQPKAKGYAREIPFLWAEEAHADAAVYEEQKRMNARMVTLDIPKWLYRDKPEQAEPKDEFGVDEKALAHILMEFDESLVIRLKAKRYNVQSERPEVYALVALADETGWEKILDYQDIYMIR